MERPRCAALVARPKMLALPPQPLRGAWNPVLPWGGDVATMQASTPMLKQFTETAPQVQATIEAMFGIYTARGHKQLSQVYDKLEFNAVFDLPFFFCRGADRMRILSNLLACPFDMTVARPTLVSLQILNNKMACIDVEAELDFYLRARVLPGAAAVLPEKVTLHGTWTCVTGDNDRIISVTEQLHNLPFLPRVFRAVWTTLITTAGLAVGGW